MKIFILIAVLVLTGVSYSFAESYLCTVENSAGMKYSEKEKKWKKTDFNEGERFTIKKNKKKYFTDQYVVLNETDPLPTFYCKEDFNKNGFLLCESNGVFKFNKNSMRFISTYEFGFIDGTDSSRNTLAIFIGKCSSF